MMGAKATRAVSIARGWSWAAQALFGDLRVRYGIKIGLAGVLALFCTQLLRLPHDNWAILTVLVMMSAQFVGSIAFKGIMRVIGIETKPGFSTPCSRRGHRSWPSSVRSLNF